MTTEHKPVIRLVGGKLTCAECGKGVSRRHVGLGKRIYVHHNPTGLIRFNGRPR